MLILSRRAKEVIVIGGNVVVTVIAIERMNGNPVVRLGIEAPKDIPVHRLEVQEAIDAGRLPRGGAR